MIESRCGILCSECGYREQMGCKGCVNIDKPFWGESCPVKSCCENKGKEHCGMCEKFPCELLHKFAYDEEQGDNGKRIEQCRKWCNINMDSIYVSCPEFENEQFNLRLISADDCDDLLKVYSDEKAIPLFNSDNCSGDDFYYNTHEKMKQALDYWKFEYNRKGFVRWSIIDKKNNAVIGTIELFHRDSKDYFNNCGLLRLDLRSDYETQSNIMDILTLIIDKTYQLFECNMIATKAVPIATERIKALKELDFLLTENKLIGHDGTEYSSYYFKKR